MCAATSPTPLNGREGPERDEMSGVASAIQYTIPVERVTKSCSYIEFYAYDPEQGKMRRKRIKTNRVKGSKKRRQYVNDIIRRLTEQLSHGWNPWIASDTSNLFTMGEAMDRYSAHIDKMLESGYYRKETYNGYKSYLKILREYSEKKKKIYYVYQFDRTYCVDFLDFVFIDRDNGAQTRNNYLNFLRVFSGFLLDKGYVKSRPTDGIAPISKRLYKKGRTVYAVHCRIAFSVANIRQKRNIDKKRPRRDGGGAKSAGTLLRV